MMPTIEELNAISRLITGRDFTETKFDGCSTILVSVHTAERRAWIVEAALSAKRNDLLQQLQIATENISQTLWDTEERSK